MRLVAIVLAALAATSSMVEPVSADGYESYKDEPARRSPQYIYSHQPAARRAGCPRELAGLKPSECRRILREVESRRARRAVAHRDPRRETVAARGRCVGHFRVEGPGRWKEAWARRAAIVRWRETVELSRRGGGAYMDERYARNFRVFGCRISGKRGVEKRCSAEGIACQP